MFRLLLSIESAQMVGLQQELDWPNTPFTQTKTPTKKVQWWRSAKLDVALNREIWKCVKQIRLALQTSVGGDTPSYNRLVPAETRYRTEKSLNFANVWR